VQGSLTVWLSLVSADIYATPSYYIGIYMSSNPPTIRKLRKNSDGAKDTGYYLLPPKNWLDETEHQAGKKILYFTLSSRAFALVLTPQFEEPKVPPPVNSSPENIMILLKHGTLLSKLRETRKGNNVLRSVNIPRAWIREREQKIHREVTALSITVEPDCIMVEPVYGGKAMPR
jgi:hypothetical protein